MSNQDSSGQNSSFNDTIDPNIDEIYSYYKDYLIPAIASSLPLLFGKVQGDIKSFFYNLLTRIVHFLIPWTRDDFVWQEVPDWIASKQENFTHFLLRNLDTDNDGHISASELLRIDAMPPITQFQEKTDQSFFRWFQYTFPLMDWKIGIFIWRSCGGLLLLIAVATIVPGKLHVWSGRVFRWPILVLTYLMIMSELVVYIMVRLFIRLAESIFATKKHRALRNGLMKAKSYDEWFGIAQELDRSMGRDQWQKTMDDDLSYKYNWVFINELISDLRYARESGDTMSALIVLRQCTRKNVGGVMNEDLFSVTYTGEPKIIVQDFLREVVTALKWLTKKSSLTENEQNIAPCEFNEDFDLHCKQDKELNVFKTSRKKPSISAKHNRKKDPNVINLIGHVVGPVVSPMVGPFVGPVAWAWHSFIGDDCDSNDHDMCNIDPPQSNEQHKVLDKVFDERKTEKKMPFEYNLKVQQREQVKTFLKRARAAYGRTALCLSGGAMMGCYHFGHVKALLEEDTLPHIISGTSAGSAIAAMVCTRTDEELRRDMQPEILAGKMTCFSRTWPDRLRNIYKNGCMFDREEWLDLLSWFTCGDLTFEEAYKKTGRILCITLSATTKKAPPVLVNYITAPDVTIASAVVASAAVPGFIKPVVLRKKGPDGIVRAPGENKDEAYRDGSIDQDIPMHGLAEMFNCQFFLTAQCNPHIVPFFFYSKGCVAQPSRWSKGLVQDSWRGGFLLAALEMYLKSDMKAKFIFLDELEAAVSFTSTMMTQMYGGTTTIVPQISISDYFMLFSNPSLKFLKKCFQNGSVAAYQHCAIMKHHYSVAHALDECLAILEKEDGSLNKPRRRQSQLASNLQIKPKTHLDERQKRQQTKSFSLNASVLSTASSHITNDSETTDGTTSSHDDECESGGFDGVTIAFDQRRIKEVQSEMK